MARNLILSPVAGAFDIAAIQGYLGAQPDVFLDPHGTGVYVACGLPEAVAHSQSARQQDPTQFPCGGFVTLRPDAIQVEQEMANEDELRSIMEFLKWISRHFECTVRDYYGQDFTEQCRKKGIESMYSESVKNMPVPWADKLIKVGFFRELEHGDIGSYSLPESRADTPIPDEERVAAYLDAGHLYIASEAIANDWLADDPDVTIGPAHILTDGTYAWPADLAYYVRNYHVRLPKPFLVHVVRNDFQVPANVDIGTLKL